MTATRPPASRASDPFGARSTLKTPAGDVQIYRLDRLAKSLGRTIDRLPYSIKVQIEAALSASNVT